MGVFSGLKSSHTDSGSQYIVTIFKLERSIEKVSLRQVKNMCHP